MADQYDYAGMRNAGIAGSLTVRGTEPLRVWVQSGPVYNFRIARIDDSSGQFDRLSPVFEGTAAVQLSTDPVRGIWNAYATFLTANWPDGIYAIDIAADKPLSPTNTTPAAAFFIVRRATTPSKILYKLPTNTWNAYCRMPWVPEGDPAYPGHNVLARSFYDDNASIGNTIPYGRPGIGFIGEDIPGWLIEPTPGRHHWFLEGHIQFIARLRQIFGDISYCTDIDLHRGDEISLLSGRRALICSGHDEYWTAKMRKSVASFVNKGGNVAWFTGNTAYWMATLAEASTSDPAGTFYTLSVDKHPTKRVDGNWGENGSEARLTGLSGRGRGGFTPDPSDYATPFIVHPSVTNGWIASGLQSDHVPSSSLELVSYEFDNVHALTPSDHVHAATTGPTVTAVDAGDANWSQATDLAASIAYFQPFGSIVNVGTTEWIKGIGDPHVDQITINSVRSFSGDRTFSYPAAFSRAGALDLFFETPLSSDNSVNAISSWLLDSSRASLTLERGKWLSQFQSVGYRLRAVGRTKSNASRVYFQNASGRVAIWDVAITPNATDTRSMRQIVNGGVLSVSSTSQLVAVGYVNAGSELDLIFAASSAAQIKIQSMSGTLGEIAGTSFDIQYPVTGSSLIAFGLLGSATAAAFLKGSILSIAELRPSGWFNRIDIIISDLSSHSKIIGFAAFEQSGGIRLAIAVNKFCIGFSATVVNGGTINLADDSLTYLSMKAGFEHDGAFI